MLKIYQFRHAKLKPPPDWQKTNNENSKKPPKNKNSSKIKIITKKTN